MKIKVIFALILLNLGLSISPIKGNDTCCTSLKLDVGAEYSRVKMSAEDSPHYRGNLWGAVAELEYQNDNCFYADITALWNEGTLRGDDSRLSIDEGVWDGVIGYTFGFGCFNQWSVTPYIGFGYRLFVFDRRESETLSHVKISYQNYFIPIGVKLNYQVDCDWQIGLNAKIMPSVDQKFYIYHVKDILWKECKKTSYLVELPITWNTQFYCFDSVAVSFVPFVKCWRLGGNEALDWPSWKQVYWGAQLNLGVYF